ncbi:MAG: hypothetical protein DVB23_002911 [Verrucomicrobia bacterium]|jgi:hypothetical protein|nr:MAG: hypothetical protein DVB23_002911 [Verrucomicrobiota bacterium]
MTHKLPAQTIELNLLSVQQLFNSMDPSPFHERDLDDDAEEFIVSWAREHPPGQAVRLVVHLRDSAGDGSESSMIRDSIHHYFDYKAELNRRDFERLMREAWISLIIGMSFLGLCAVVVQALSHRSGAWPDMIREGLTITGWVAMWRPLDIYLYRWWPVHELGRIYRKLSKMPIEVNVAKGG